MIPAQTVARLACSDRLQVLLEAASGEVVSASPVRRDPPAWMVRQLRWRDGTCRFPGCGARRFTQAHHLTWFSKGGRTELGNLVLVCSFHHRLVHEHGWRLERTGDAVVWYRPDGRRYRAGPEPGTAEPEETATGPPRIGIAGG